METFQLLMDGIATVLQPSNLVFAVIGCFIGTLTGILPGFGPPTATAILIPITFALEPTPAIIMLAAIYYGAMYGGTITSVLVNVPGEAASVITCIEGYEMAKKGRAGPALAVSAVGSFIGGTFATMGLVLVAVPLTSFALRFGPPEFFCLLLVGLSLVTGLAGKSMIRALKSALLGLLVGTVGIDPFTGTQRLVFGQIELFDGFDIVPVVIGCFGVREILLTVGADTPRIFTTSLRSLVPTFDDLRVSAPAIARGTAIGFFLGIIPGVGAMVPTFMSYVVERKVSKHPEMFGTGLIEAVAGPETANNAYANASLIPLFALGIPGNVTVAVLMGAFMMYGLIPGPFLFTEEPRLVWAVIASLYVGNLILVVMNLPLIPLWVSILRVPYSVLFALILSFCVVGAYSMNNTVFDIGVMLAFGIVGCAFTKLDIPLAPFALTLVLGPMMEKSLRASLEMSGGDFVIFFTRPISLTLLLIAALVVFTSTRGLASKVKEVGDTTT